MKSTKIFTSFLIVILILNGCSGGQQNTTAAKPEQAAEEQQTIDFYVQKEENASLQIINKLTELREKIDEKNMGFSVGVTSVALLDINKITGEKKLTPEENETYKRQLQKKDSLAQTKNLEKVSNYITVNGVTLSPTMNKLDLREYKLVTSIKDQGAAGCCWAFGSMAAYEGNYDVMNALDINTSEQYIINCSGAGTTDGGLAIDVFNWMVDRKRNVDDEANTPYIAGDAPCSSKLPNTNYYATTWHLVDPGNDPSAIATVEQIKDALCKHGVISVSVYADELFQYYSGGVFNENTSYDGTNHAVAIVGWDDSKNAWILKNSWGPGWGETCGYGTEKGYMWIGYKTNNIGRRAAWVTALKK